MSTQTVSAARSALVNAIAGNIAKRMDNGSPANLTPDDATALVAAIEAFVDAVLASKLLAMSAAAAS
jgi:hypothetical protein